MRSQSPPRPTSAAFSVANPDPAEGPVSHRPTAAAHENIRLSRFADRFRTELLTWRVLQRRDPSDDLHVPLQLSRADVPEAEKTAVYLEYGIRERITVGLT